MAIAKHSDWKTTPLPERQTVVPLDHSFTKNEMTLIRRGLVPLAMEDKWFIYWQDDALHMHRSWTGICACIARFESLDDGGARMVEARINRDPEQWQETSDEKDAKMISLLVRTLLLRRPPLEADAEASPANALEQWSLMGRASLGEHPSTDADA